MDWMVWQDRALCATPEAQQVAEQFQNTDGSTPRLLDLFYPALTDPNPRKRIQAVQKLCSACPVQEQCARHALSSNETEGIWGGLTKSKRDELRKKVN